MAECPICFDELCSEQCVSFNNDNSSSRSCGHYFHEACASSLISRECPICRQQFSRISRIPNPLQDPEGWFLWTDSDGDGSLSFDEICSGLQCQLPLDWNRICADTDSLWGRWDSDGSGGISLREFVNPETGVLSYIRRMYPTATRDIPNITTHKLAWFSYWDEDGSNALEKGEVLRAFIKTFRLKRKGDQGRELTEKISSVVEAVWPVFDTDMSGSIDKDEFLSRDGLADTIVATLQMG